MNPGDIQATIFGALTSLASSTVFVLALFIGFCLAIGFVKLRRSDAGSLVFRSLEEKMSHHPDAYLLPEAPHGPSDQLRSPELLEAAARQSR